MSEKTLRKVKRQLPLYLMALPGLIYLLINNYIPMSGLVVAFKNFNFKDGIYSSPWCGFQNFKYLFSTSTSFVITRNTLLYNLVFIVLNTVVAIAIAILLNEIKNRFFVKSFQTVILLPYLLSIIIIGYLVYAFLSNDMGFVNTQILRPMGKEEINWYTTPQYWPFILVFVNTLKNFGFLAIIYYATVISIRKAQADLVYHASVFEAHSHHDGAAGHRQDFLLRLRPVLPGAAKLRGTVQCDQYHRYLCVPGPDSAGGCRYGVRRRRVSVHRRVRTDLDHQSDRS